MSELGTYIPAEVSVLIAGILPLEGFYDGTFVNVVKDVTPYTLVRTPDGTTARKHNRSFSYTINFTLYSASKYNDLLTKLLLIDETSQRGKFPILIKDNSGTSLFFGSTCWIESTPELNFSNGLDSRIWTLRAMGSVANFGGNETVASDIERLVNGVVQALPGLQGIV